MVIWPDYLALSILNLPWLTLRRLIVLPLALVFLIGLSIVVAAREWWGVEGSVAEKSLGVDSQPPALRSEPEHVLVVHVGGAQHGHQRGDRTERAVVAVHVPIAGGVTALFIVERLLTREFFRDHTIETTSTIATE